VLDTNVLLSATFWNGASNRLVNSIVSEKAECVLSNSLLDEYLDVLQRKEISLKIQDRSLAVSESVRKMIDISVITIPEISLNVVKNDPDDNMVLECALSAGVDYIVTNDKHLLSVSEFAGIKIVDPETMLKILEY
jgi:uncharacterized protein